MTKSFPWGASRPPRWPWWSSVNSPYAVLCPKIIWKSSPIFVQAAGLPRQGSSGLLSGNVVRGAAGRGGRQGIAATGDALARRWKRGEPHCRAGAPGQASIESIKAETQRLAPPLLYDLTELQRHANRLYGFSAQKTLDLAQALYESHKLISYPRTDSRHLSQEVAGTLPRIVKNIEGPYLEHLAPGTGSAPWGGGSSTTPR